MIPRGVSWNVKRYEERSPGGEPLNGFGDISLCRCWSDKTRHLFVEPVHPDETEVDQSGNAQSHVVDPDQYPEQIERQDIRKNFKTPGLEACGIGRNILIYGKKSADGPVLIIPGRLRHHAQT